MLHHYVVTEPVEEIKQLDSELPVVRDPYCSSYLRQEQNGILVGIYETEESHDCLQDISWDFSNELLPPELERLEPWLLKACERFPLFGEYGIRRTVAGAITHTPDGNFLAGPAPGRPNYWMCCGASIGIGQGGGAGKYLAEWMVHGQSEINMAELDPRRFGDWAVGDFCHAVSLTDYEHMYALLAPGDQHEAGRPVRTSGLYNKLKSKGAVYHATFGWERPKWFDKRGESETFSHRRTNWFAPVGAECRAVREAARIYLAAGAEEVAVPVLPPLRITSEAGLAKADDVDFPPASAPLISAHQQGGVRFAPSAKDGAANPEGEVYGTRDVYVFDSSGFPSSASSHTMAPIMTVAHYLSDRLLAR